MPSPPLHRLLERLSHVLREDLRQVATGHGLKLAQLEALQFLARANRFSDTLSSLAAYLGSTKGTVSQTLSALVRKGLVVRVQDPNDGRVQHCRLTAAGRTVAEEALALELQAAVPDAVTETLGAVLTSALAARGGIAFGVCATCAHHGRRGPQRWCGLLNVPLEESDAEKLCKEHQAGAASGQT